MSLLIHIAKPHVHLGKSVAPLFWLGAGLALASVKTTTLPNPPPGPEPPVPTEWTPKWALGDVLYSHNLPGANWTVQEIIYASKQYRVMFYFAGGAESILVDAANLESSDIYKG